MPFAKRNKKKQILSTQSSVVHVAPIIKSFTEDVSSAETLVYAPILFYFIEEGSRRHPHEFQEHRVLTCTTSLWQLNSEGEMVWL